MAIRKLFPRVKQDPRRKADPAGSKLDESSDPLLLCAEGASYIQCERSLVILVAGAHE